MIASSLSLFVVILKLLLTIYLYSSCQKPQTTNISNQMIKIHRWNLVIGQNSSGICPTIKHKKKWEFKNMDQRAAEVAAMLAAFSIFLIGTQNPAKSYSQANQNHQVQKSISIIYNISPYIVIFHIYP